MRPGGGGWLAPSHHLLIWLAGCRNSVLSYRSEADFGYPNSDRASALQQVMLGSRKPAYDRKRHQVSRCKLNGLR